jgi:leucyl-tRNA synthetase (EC 6.1.1.4)
VGAPGQALLHPHAKLAGSDEEAARDEEITLVVQVNGKLRDRILVAPGISDAEAQEKALASEAVQQALDGKPVRKVIIVPGRLVNVVRDA